MSAALSDGHHDVPPGKLAAVVTSLQMFQKPAQRAMADRADVSIVRQGEPTAEWYRDLYARVGADWLWSSRLKLRPEALLDIIRHPEVEVYALMADGRAEGLLELDFRQAKNCELVFFGVTSRMIGSGAGRFLMNTAIERAWSRPINRFWVHTCSLDHPAALAFYCRSGFVPYNRQVEIFDDPRAIGMLPPHVAIDVPRL